MFRVVPSYPQQVFTKPQFRKIILRTASSEGSKNEMPLFANNIIAGTNISALCARDFVFPLRGIPEGLRNKL